MIPQTHRNLFVNKLPEEFTQCYLCAVIADWGMKKKHGYFLVLPTTFYPVLILPQILDLSLFIYSAKPSAKNSFSFSVAYLLTFWVMNSFFQNITALWKVSNPGF